MKISILANVTALVIFACLVVGCGGGGTSASTGPAPIVAPSPTNAHPFSETIAIKMNAPWTDAGFVAVAGDQISIASSGTFNRETGFCNGQCLTTPGGAPWTVCATQPPPAFTAPNLPCWSLIGKIGSLGKPFFVGTALTFSPAATGEFYLGINDNYYPDDTGTWTSAITER